MEIGSTAMYEQIKKDIIDQILDNTYKENSRIPSEHEITKMYKVSRITASKALAALASEGFIFRVQGKGSFVKPGVSAKKTVPLVTDEKNTVLFKAEDLKPIENIKKIGVLIPGLNDFHGLNIIRAISETLVYPKYFVSNVMSNCKANSFFSLENYTLKSMLTSGYDGIIIFPVDTELYNETILAMQVAKFPFVLIERTFPGINCNSVSSDNVMGARLATEHLIKLGHKKIAFCSTSTINEQITELRYNSYCSTMQKHMLPVRSFHNKDEDYKSSSDSSQLRQALVNREITGAVASNTTAAIDLYKMCERHAIRIPEEFSIVCFDNPSQHVSRSNFFTYIEQQSYDMGKQAALIIDNQLNTAESDFTTVKRILIPELIVNSSTAANHLL